MVEITICTYRRETAQTSQPWLKLGGVVQFVRRPRIQTLGYLSVAVQKSKWHCGPSPALTGDVEIAAQIAKQGDSVQGWDRKARGKEEEGQA